MDTAELGLDDDARDVDLMELGTAPELPSRLPSGTIAPALNDLEGLRGGIAWRRSGPTSR